MIFPNEKLDEIAKKDLYPRFVCRDLTIMAKAYNYLADMIAKDFDVSLVHSGDKIHFMCNRCNRLVERFSKHDCY